MSSKQRRALIVGLCLALVLVLSEAVERLSSETRITINASNLESIEDIKRELALDFAGDSADGGNVTLSVDNAVRVRRSGSYIEFLEEQDEPIAIDRDGAYFVLATPVSRTVADLTELNQLKSDLDSQRDEILEKETLDNNDRQEIDRISNQIAVINTAIDAVVEEGKPSENSDRSDAASSSIFSARLRESVLESAPNSRDASSTLSSVRFLSGVANRNSNWIKAAKWICYFIATVVGIFFKAMWDSSDFKSLLRFSSIKPLLIAPIVFYGVYATIHTLTDSLLAVLIAFQNGFFWQSILKAEERKYATATSQARLASADNKTIETVASYKE